MPDSLLSHETVPSARRSTRRIPRRLRPLWEAYQTAWKTVSDVMDEEDAAMQVRPKDAPQGSTQAERKAKRKRAVADKAFEAATTALTAAPTRTVDDAVCRIEYVLDQVPDSDVEAALKGALRVLRKVNAAA